MNKKLSFWRLVVFAGLTAIGLHGHAETPLPSPLLKTSLQQDAHASDGVSFRVLCYHDVRDKLADTLKAWPESAALDTQDLIEHFEWLKANGYHVVSLDAILAARNGGPKLPPKPVLLSFDDGYASLYTRVFPLLKLFNYPAVVGLVGEWLQAKATDQVFYGDRWMPRDQFVSWSQVREMVASGLVEVASHSHSLHKGVISNPQGNAISAAVTRMYDPSTQKHESDSAYFERLRADLARNSDLIARHTGQKPRVMIWPYGAYNMTGVKAAQAQGMPITMSLDVGPNTPDHPLSRIRRDILFFNDKVSDLERNLNQRAEYDGLEQPMQRIVSVDLDAIYDPDPIQQEKKVGALIEHIVRLRINTVYVRALADADGDGQAEAAYFPNRHLPMRADLLNRMAWQLRTRGVKPPEFLDVYVWLPQSSLKRLQVRAAQLIEVYDDLGKNAPRVAGLVIDADDTLPAADSTSSLIAAFKAGQPNAMTAYMLSANAVLSLQSDAQKAALWAARARPSNSYVVLPISSTSNTQLKTMATALAHVPGALDSTVFLLATNNNSGSSPHLATQLQRLQQMGARNFGVDTGKAALGPPSLVLIRPALSLQTHLGGQP